MTHHLMKTWLRMGGTPAFIDNDGALIFHWSPPEAIYERQFITLKYGKYLIYKYVVPIVPNNNSKFPNSIIICMTILLLSA